MVEFYPWFNFYFPLFLYSLSVHYHARKQREIKIAQRIKLNHNIYTVAKCSVFSVALRQVFE